LDIPDDLAAQFGADPIHLTRTALEAMALEGVRSGKLSVAQARRLLGIPSRYEMDGFLKSHGVLLDLTFDDIKRDAEIALKYSR
jgi:hypothetical protein